MFGTVRKAFVMLKDESGIGGLGMINMSKRQTTPITVLRLPDIRIEYSYDALIARAMKAISFDWGVTFIKMVIKCYDWKKQHAINANHKIREAGSKDCWSASCRWITRQPMSMFL